MTDASTTRDDASPAPTRSRSVDGNTHRTAARRARHSRTSPSAQRSSMSKKGLLAVALLVVSLVAVAGVLDPALRGERQEGRRRRLASGSATGRRPPRPSRAGWRCPLRRPPAAPRVAPRRASRPWCRPPTRAAEPIGVRRTGAGAPARAARQGDPSRGCTRPAGHHPARAHAQPAPPRARRAADAGTASDAGDASRPPNDPLADDARNLQAYQRQLQGLLDNADAQRPRWRPAQAAGIRSVGCPPSGCLLSGAPSHGAPARRRVGLFGGQLQGSATPARGGLDARQPQPDPAQGHGLHLRAEDQGHQRGVGPRRLPGAAQRLQRRRPRAADRARLAPGRRVPRRLGATRHRAHPGAVDAHPHAERRDGRHRVARHRPARRVRHRRLRRQPLGRAHRRGDAAVADRRLGASWSSRTRPTTRRATRSSCRRRRPAPASWPRRCSTAPSTSRR